MRKELYGHEISVLRDTFRRLLRRHAKTNIVKLIKKTHPADLALLFRYFNDVEQKTLFNLMDDPEKTAEFLIELDDGIVAPLLEDEDPQRIVQFFRELGSNDQAYILGLLPEEKAQSIMDLMRAEEQEEVEEIMAYPEDSAGSIMSTDVFTLNQDTLAKDAIAALQGFEQAEMVFYLYVTDEDNRLAGVISLRDLVTTKPDATLKDIMIKQVHSVRPETDQEEVAKIVSRYNYLALPVVDMENHILGIVTVDDVVDIIREEATEDFLQMAGVGKDREILLKSTFEESKLRFPWLFATWLGGIVATIIVTSFGDLLNRIFVLAAFMPIIAGMGGNMGTQSSTIVVRGMATGRVDFGNAFKIILKEIRVGLILGAFYGLLLGIYAYFRFYDVSPYLGLVVGLSIYCSMLIATTIGAFVPIFLRRIGVDPAIATGPFVTTSIDILGVSIYFLIATALLPV
ncbi:MAG: magnesium transporter [FCB group bacterium]|nr:magnesium transporter [FCB group bacterium]